jgi:hypothetical protein
MRIVAYHLIEYPRVMRVVTYHLIECTRGMRIVTFHLIEKKANTNKIENKSVFTNDIYISKLFVGCAPVRLDIAFYLVRDIEVSKTDIQDQVVNVSLFSPDAIIIQ